MDKINNLALNFQEAENNQEWVTVDVHQDQNQSVYGVSDKDQTGLRVVLEHTRPLLNIFLAALNPQHLKSSHLQERLAIVLSGVAALQQRYEQWMYSCNGLMYRTITAGILCEDSTLASCEAIRNQLELAHDVLESLPNLYAGDNVPPKEYQQQLTAFLTACLDEANGHRWQHDVRMTDFFAILADRYPFPDCVRAALRDPSGLENGLAQLLARVTDGTALPAIYNPILERTCEQVVAAYQSSDLAALRAGLARFITGFNDLRDRCPNCLLPGQWGAPFSGDGGIQFRLQDQGSHQQLFNDIENGSAIVPLFRDRENILKQALKDCFSGNGDFGELENLFKVLDLLSALNPVSYQENFSQLSRGCVEEGCDQALASFYQKLQQVQNLWQANTKPVQLCQLLRDLMFLAIKHPQTLAWIVPELDCDDTIKALLADPSACLEVLKLLNGHPLEENSCAMVKNLIARISPPEKDKGSLRWHPGGYFINSRLNCKKEHIEVDATHLCDLRDLVIKQKVEFKCSSLEVKGLPEGDELIALVELMKHKQSLTVWFMGPTDHAVDIDLSVLADAYGDNLNDFLSRIHYRGPVNLNVSQYPNIDDALLRQCIESFLQVMDLNLSGCQLVTAKGLFRCLELLPAVASLDYSNTRIEDRDLLSKLPVICPFLDQVKGSHGGKEQYAMACQTVGSYEWGSPESRYVSLMQLEPLLRRLAGLETFVIHPDAPLKRLSDLFKLCPALQQRKIKIELPSRLLSDRLELSRMHPATCQYLLQQYAPGLRRLRLEGMDVNGALLQVLVNLEQLSHLDVSTCRSSTDLVRALTWIPHLRNIRLPSEKLEDGMEDVRAMKTSNPFLLRTVAPYSQFLEKTLEMYRGPKELLFLIQQEMWKRGVQEIFPQDQLVVDADSLFFWLAQFGGQMEHMPVNMVAQTLYADRNPLVNAQTAKELPRCFPKARQMSFKGCGNLSEQACADLLTQLHRCSNIESLDLSGCVHVTDRVFLYPDNTINLPQSLKKLYLTGTQVTQKVLQALVRKHSNLEIIVEPSCLVEGLKCLSSEPTLENAVTLKWNGGQQAMHRAQVKEFLGLEGRVELDIGARLSSQASRQAFVSYLHTGELLPQLSAKEAIELYALAQSPEYRLEGLMLRCENMIKRSLHQETLEEVWAFANQYKRKDLRLQCWLFAHAFHPDSEQVILQEILSTDVSLFGAEENSADVTIHVDGKDGKLATRAFHKRILEASSGKLRKWLSEGHEGFGMGDVVFNLEDPDLLSDDLNIIHALLYQRAHPVTQSEIMAAEMVQLSEKLTRLCAVAHALKWSDLMHRLEDALVAIYNVRQDDAPQLGWIKALGEKYKLEKVHV